MYHEWQFALVDQVQHVIEELFANLDYKPSVDQKPE